jgi:uncharacterized protein DUF1918
MPSLVARFNGVDPRPAETSAMVWGEMAGTEVIGMVGKTRDRIIVESEKVGRPAREGEILEIIEASYGTRYRVSWDDGHESTLRPAAGSAKVIPAPKRRSK